MTELENGSNDELMTLLDNPPQTIEELVAAISPGLYGRLKSGIELGKWDDGQRLDKAQLEQCMQLVIMYEAQNLPEHERIGAPLAKKSNCESDSASANAPGIESRPISVIQGNSDSASDKH